MSFLDRLFRKQIEKAVAMQLEQKAAAYQPGVRYNFSNGVIIGPGDNKQAYVKDGYSVNDIIYSVINLILNKVRLPEWHIYKVVDGKESSLKRSNRLLANSLTLKDHRDGLRLKDESLDQITSFNLQTGKLNDLLEYPNKCDTFQDLVVKSTLLKLLTGDLYIWGEILSAGANAGIPNSLWTLPSQFMTIIASKGFPAEPLGYELFTWNQSYTVEEVLHSAMPNPNFDINSSDLYGFAPLRAFCKNTIRNNAAKDASSAKYRNGGAEAIISFGDSNIATQNPQFAKEQMQNLKLQHATEYAGALNQGKPIFSGYPVNVSPLGMSPVELGIIDSEKWDALMFCNGYNVPPELAGLTQKTFNNVIEAQKALIQGAVMPLLDTFRRALNRKLQTDWGFKGKNLYVDYTTDPFPELEADVSKTMDWMSKVTAVRPNEERIAVGLDADPDPLMNELWILNGAGVRVPLSDFQANIVDQTLANANGQTNMGNGNGNASANTEGNGGVSNGNAKDVRLKKAV